MNVCMHTSRMIIFKVTKCIQIQRRSAEGFNDLAKFNPLTGRCTFVSLVPIALNVALCHLTKLLI